MSAPLLRYWECFPTSGQRRKIPRYNTLLPYTLHIPDQANTFYACAFRHIRDHQRCLRLNLGYTHGLVTPPTSRQQEAVERCERIQESLLLLRSHNSGSDLEIQLDFLRYLHERSAT